MVFAALSVLLVVAVVVVWQRLGDSLDREADTAAATCVEGSTTVPVIADPDLAPALSEIAAAYGKTKPVVRDHCITVAVRPADAQVVLDGLRGSWDAASMGPYPAVWVPQSSVWSAQLVTARPEVVDGRPESLVTSPVVLATSTEFADAANDLQWSELPELQRRDNSLVDLGVPGSLRMAMPAGAQSDASALAAQAVVAQTLRASGPLTDASVRSPDATSAVTGLTEGAPRSPDGTPAAAVRVIADAGGPANAPIRSVPITEQKLYQLTRSDDRARIAALRPGGPTPAADFPVIRLSSDQVPVEAAAAMSEFVTFAGRPDQQRILTTQGFRGSDTRPAASATVDFPAVADPLPLPQPDAIVRINRLIYGPPS